MKPVIVTGGIASGKSTVINVWREMGVAIASADDIAKEVFEREAVQATIAKEVGKENISRDEIRALIAENLKFRSFLNNLTHPLILCEIEESKADAIEIPLAVEACLWNSGRELVVIWCPVDITKQRLIERGLGDLEAEGLIKSQASPDMRLCFADYVIRTNGELSAVLESAREIGNALF